MGQAAATSARLEDKYFVQKVKLGEGSFGVVWRAVDRNSQETVAMKQMDKKSMPKRGIRPSDVEREISVMQAVRHDNLLRLYDAFDTPASVCLALEYCDGGDFGDKMKERGDRLRESEAADWVSQIFGAIAELHRSLIIHRDIKPDNFMVKLGSKGSSLKLADFGLAKLDPGLQDGRHRLREKCGTPAFMAPELALLPRSDGYSFPVDIFAAGVTMFMLLAGGRHPWVNDRNQLDEHARNRGQLTFVEPTKGLFGFAGTTPCRFSSAAQDLCRRMVSSRPEKRVTAAAALQDIWLKNQATAQEPLHAAALSWAAHQAIKVEEGMVVDAAIHTLERSITMSIEDAVGKLNHRSISCPEGILCMFSELHQCRFVLLRSDKVCDGSNVVKQVEREQVEPADATASRGSWFAAATDMLHPLARVVSMDSAHREDEALQRQLWHQNAALQSELEDQLCRAQAAAAREDALRLLMSQSASALQESSGGVLPAGTKCRYMSKTYNASYDTVVQRFNAEDGTYDVDCRPHASPEFILPRSDVSKGDAWPSGARVMYKCEDGKWLPAEVLSFNEGEPGTYNLHAKRFVEVDAIRAWIG